MERENNPEDTIEQEQSKPLFSANFGTSLCFADMLVLLLLGCAIGWGSKPTQQDSTYPTKPHRKDNT